jgi:hypothetical protein
VSRIQEICLINPVNHYSEQIRRSGFVIAAQDATVNGFRPSGSAPLKCVRKMAAYAILSNQQSSDLTLSVFLVGSEGE